MTTFSGKTLLAVTFLLSLFSNIVAAQTEDQLVDQYKKALQKALDEKSIQSIELSGDFIIQKFTLPVLILYKAPNSMRIEMSFQNIKFLQIQNDSIKWEYNPFEDKNEITHVNSSEKGFKNKDNRAFNYIVHDLLNYKELKHNLKLLRKEKIDSVDAYVLELTRNDKSKSDYYLNTKNNLLYKAIHKDGYQVFGNYVNRAGFVFPLFMIDSNPKETMEGRFSQIKCNESIADSLFVIPKKAFEITAKQKNVLEALLDRGDTFYNKEQYDSAVAAFSEAIAMDAKNYRAHNSRGLSKIQLKEYYEAIADLTRAVELNSNGANAYNNRGLAKYYLGDKTGAVKDYSKALEIEPTLTVALKNRGLVYYETQQYEDASKDFTEVIKINPKDGESYFKNAVTLAQLEKYDEAILGYETAIKNEYGTSEVYNYKGVSEYKKGDFENAKASFYQALVLKDDNLQYRENYGRALYELGDYLTAAYQFDEYVKKQNDNPEIFNMKGLCQHQVKNYKGAIKDFSQAISLKENATYFDNRAASKEMIKDLKGAVEDYNESIRLYPTDASVFYKRGLIKLKISKNSDGCRDLSTAHEMKYEPAKEAMKKNCN